MTLSPRTSRDPAEGLRLPYWLGLGTALWLASCAGDFYSADVAGFVKRKPPSSQSMAEEPAGINGVEVRVFLREPEGFDSDGFIVHTRTSPNRAAGEPLDGYFSHRVAWEASSSDFGEEGDSRTLWLATRHPDYHSTIVEVPGVLSDSVNLIPDVLLAGIEMQAGPIEGRVLLDGIGENGVRVVMHLEDRPGTVYETRTAPMGDDAGFYTFNDVSWPDDDGETKSATISVDDPEYRSLGEVSVELSDGFAVDVESPIEIQSNTLRIPSLVGTVVDALSNGVSGVRVRASADGVVGVRRWATITDEAGRYGFTDLAYLPEGAEDGTDTIHVAVDDPAYTQVSNGGEPIPATVASGRNTEVTELIMVARSPRTQFAATLTGRCVERVESDLGDVRFVPLAGVSVELTFEDGEGPQLLVNQTDEEGRYEFLLEWTDTEPRADAPTGEDSVEATLRFDPFERGNERFSFDEQEIDVRSWIDANVAPEAVGLSR